MKTRFLLLIFCSLFLQVSAHQEQELNSGWVCRNIRKVEVSGNRLSKASYHLRRWLPATVPGTVLTTLLNDKKIPDPFYGMNNKKIPDIYNTGRDYYTYWFVKNFTEPYPTGNEQVYLNFRGVNYSCNVYLNGHKVNAHRHYGMFLRQSYNITSLLEKNGKNRLAVIVYPPNPVGNPNGGQGGDGTIARNVAIQYPAGWDWIEPIHDRNTGIWDKVTIVRTKGVLLKYPHIITLVPGKRLPNTKVQAPATIKASVVVSNPTRKEMKGDVQYSIANHVIKQHIDLKPESSQTIHFSNYLLHNPRLWWPNGYGKHPLYNVRFQFVSNKNQILDEISLKAGIRQIETSWNSHTRSRQVYVNGQKIFIKGGNWIISDEMLRLSPQRYDAEVRFHRDMNLNLIRVWGGALTERPAFYNACDKYGLLVFQDFWFSGDCNGRWLDPMKKDNQWTRRKYPDDHALALASMRDQIRMIRNHPSLAFWCGGNEIPPPKDILQPLEDSILPKLDGTRYFFEYSNSDSMSYNSLGGNGDGPYGIQNPKHFWSFHTFPFNSEVGSVGLSDYKSLLRFIPKKDMVVPHGDTVDSVWTYHKYIGYGKRIGLYGKPTNVKEFCKIAQLVNYNQYRALSEGFSAHSWDWYTGFIIWKTQNPWTAMRGQMYDYYLDPNAGLYGLREGAQPLHVMCNPNNGMVMTVNNTFYPYHDLMLISRTFNMKGKVTSLNKLLIYLSPTSVQPFYSVSGALKHLRKNHGGFLQLQLVNDKQKVLSENLYWIADSTGHYSGLDSMKTANIHATARKINSKTIAVILKNPNNNPIAFFMRVSLINPETGKRILPVFYDNNYISVLPGKTKVVHIFLDSANQAVKNMKVCLSGWNVKTQTLEIQ